MPRYSLPTDPAALSAHDVCKAFYVDPAKGLRKAQVDELLDEFGRNELPEEQQTPFWGLVLSQFDDVLVRILLLAAAISFVMAVVERDVTGFVEPFIILLILTLNAIVGVWQESHAERAISALRDFIPATATVIRSGKVITILAEELVPGDIVDVAVGSRVPADIRLLHLESTTFRVDQSILNGESEEVMKNTSELKGKHDRFPPNMVYSGTAVVYGKARGIVVRTGGSTEIGSIERDVREQENGKTPLQVKLDEFGVLLSKVIGYICLAVFIVNMFNWLRTQKPSADEPWYERYMRPTVHCLKVAVALAVAAIPEGLPAVVTTCLALGTRRMARHNAIVRDLPSVETLGRCTVICSDKTGTLTTNMMSVVNVVTLEDTKKSISYELVDSKYNPCFGGVSVEGRVILNPTSTDSALEMLSTIGVLCNDATLHYHSASGNVQKVGEATEAALLVMGEKLVRTQLDEDFVVDRFRREKEALWKREATLEFTRSRKSMSICCRSTTQSKVSSLFVKGAPEELLQRCSRVMLADGQIVKLDAKMLSVFSDQMNLMSNTENALRCIGFAFKPVEAVSSVNLSDPSTFAKIESDLVFVGVCGILDPPRADVADAINKCHTAGIRVIVITGDKKETAEAVCRKIGILHSGSTAGLSYTGHEFDKMTPTEKRRAVMSAALFSRTDPSHKMELVTLLQEQKLICAMTGDGVNDSPALKKADIGIAMGSGTEVAKAASKMVLADDNFATVMKAVREGRSIYNNTKQFIRYLISSNIGEVACVLATGLMGLPDALAPIQLLWVNLVTDGLPATALGFNSPDDDVMEQPPRDVDEPIVNGWMFVRYMIVGTYVGLATVCGFLWWFLTNGFSWSDLTSFTTCTDMRNSKCVILANPETARAIALSILVVVEMLNALNALSENQSLVITRPSTNIWLILAILSSLALHLGIMYIPFFARMFSIAPLGVHPAVVASANPWTVLIPTDFEDWKTVLVFSIPVIFIDEALKFVSRLMKNREAL